MQVKQGHKHVYQVIDCTYLRDCNTETKGVEN